MAPKTSGEQDADMAAVLEKVQPLTRDGLQVLRQSAHAAQTTGAMNPLTFRMQVESIDAALLLEAAITKLDRTSSCLAKVGIAVTAAGVLLAIAQAVATWVLWKH